MIVPTTILLIATAAFPVLTGIGVLLAVMMGQRTWGLILTRLGLGGGAVCAAILAVLIGQEAGDSASVIRVPLWTWFSFSIAQAPSVTFGLGATSIKACLISLTGGLAFIAIWNADSQTKRPLSSDAILATSLLYAAGTVLIFAPNTVQALLAWGAVSLTAGILIRLSHLQPNASRINADAPRIRSTGASEFAQAGLIRRLQYLGDAAASLERIYVEYVWKSITNRFPNWIGEEAESLECSSVSFQLLTTVLGASAILLTWLIGS